MQTRAKREQHVVQADALAAPRRAPVEYMLHLIATGEKIAGPLDPKLSRIGQQITEPLVADGALDAEVLAKVRASLASTQGSP